ncbi:MAG: penicillin-binding protein activator [Rhodospirillaceae bacterium]|nr:penicillin-binding protein activator [Rhodospirillaceae bacterium]
MTSYYARIPSRRQIMGAAGALLFGLSLAACSTTDRDGPKTTASRPEVPPGRLAPGSQVTVAILLPLTGERARLGKAMQRAAEMAVLEQGARNMKLLTFDTRGTPEGSVAALDQAIQQGAKLILGPVFSDDVAAVRQRAEAANINVIAFSNDTKVAGGNVYLLSFMLKQQIDNVVAYAAGQGRKRIAVVAPANDYGAQVTEMTRDAARKVGAEVTRTGTYKPDTMEVTDDIKAFSGATGVDRKGRVGRMAPLDFDAVMIADGGTKLRMVASLLAYFDVDPDKVRYLGTGRWDDRSLRRELSLRGGWYAAPDPRNFERFSDKYKAAYGEDPPRIATLAYDGVALAAALAKKPDGIDFGKQALTDPSGFAGIDGIFRFTPNGLSERGLAVVEIGRDEVNVVGEAPKSFATPGTH